MEEVVVLDYNYQEHLGNWWEGWLRKSDQG